MTRIKQKRSIVLPFSMLIIGLFAGYFIAQNQSDKAYQAEVAILQESLSENTKEINTQKMLIEIRQDKVALLRELLADASKKKQLAPTP